MNTRNISDLACVASISNRVIARKLEWEQKKKVEVGGGGKERTCYSVSRKGQSGMRKLNCKQHIN